MVVVVSTTQYPKDLEQKFSAHFSLFPFPLSPFQKHAIQGLVEGNHVLITAHTGSGKTLPAEFAIQHFVLSKQKKVIYCSPIKALSNQKFYEFQSKYPNISFGLLTGDNKINPAADVLIMTTEILLNTLFLLQQGSRENQPAKNADFEIDVETQLSCVVFDEVHYINDPHRGHVWEKSIMLLPPQVQMLMLSATIDKASEFAEWIENISKPVSANSSVPKKSVVLSSTNVRVVPLSHYAYITTTEAAFKKIKDKQIQQEIRSAINEPLLIQDATGQFKETVYQNMVVKTLNRLNVAQIDVKRKYVLNRLLDHLKSPDGSIGLDNRGKTMLPALLFLFSRKQVEICAREITARLLDDDSKIPYTIRAECDALLRSKLPNHHEYSSLPEYEFLVSLLEKGIGIHHSGMISVFREIVELFISKKYIQLLIATESFAIGLDCPIKTVIFTHFQKFDGNGQRTLLSHEYTQMAGRAGRRGIDTVGYVIHCNNLFKPPSALEYRQMLSGKPENFVSKLDITAQMVLQIINTGNGEKTTDEIMAFIKGSMMNQNTEAQIRQQEVVLKEAQQELEKIQSELDTASSEENKSLLERFCDLEKQEVMANHKKLKEIAKEKESIQSKIGSSWPSQYALWKKKQEVSQKVQEEQQYLDTLLRHIYDKIQGICEILEKNLYLEKKGTTWTLTERGKLASQFKEVDGIVMANLLLNTGHLEGWTASDLVALLSCFCEVRAENNDENPVSQSDWKDDNISTTIQHIKQGLELMEMESEQQGVYLWREPVIIQGILYRRMERWIQATDKEACSQFLQSLLEDCEIGAGDFVKIILKIIAIKKEMERNVSSVSLQFVLSQIDELICKFIATSQSLYL